MSLSLPRTWLAVLMACSVATLPLLGGSLDNAGQLTLRGVHDEASGAPVVRDGGSGSFDLRWMPTIRDDDTGRLDLHYELLGTYRYGDEAAITGAPGIPLPRSDRNRFMNLERELDGAGDWRWRHRVDRLVWTQSGRWGALSIGRQAVTWGNGLVFNPMDLFSPFAPTDVERDFKQGEDMLHLSLYPDDWNAKTGLQLLVLPGRDPRTSTVKASESSFALKAHRYIGETEWDFLVGSHYGEAIAGVGNVRLLGGAVWRWDAVLSFPGDGDPIISTVTNLDYSWIWGGMNFYGSLEFHYNSAGTDTYSGLAGDEELLRRLSRGEMHTLGRVYTAGNLQVELHPLLNFHFSAILNARDPSAVLLPRLVWSALQSLEVTLGAQIHAGGSGTEFGGFRIEGSSRQIASPDRAYLWIKAFF